MALGSFTLTNAVSDANSGPASSQTATLGSTPTNWTHTPSTVSTPTGGPYVSNSFSWTAGATSSPTEAVTGRDVDGNTAVTNLSFVNDSTAPSAGTISYLDGTQPGNSVPVTFTTGTDGGSGIATRQLQRQSAPLTGGTCGTWSGYTDLGSPNPTSIYDDTSVTNATCYMYRYVVTDQVGNQRITTGTDVSKVDFEPIVTTTVAPLAYIENGTPFLDDLVGLADGDSANFTSATVDMTTNYVNGQDTLAFTNQNGITGSWTASTGVMALSGTATVAQYQTALRSITYNNNSNWPNTSTRTVTFVVNDGTNTSNTASRNITITAVNDAPAGSPWTATINEDATYTFATADFGFYDTGDNGANALLAVKMTTLPASGLLKLSGVNVTVGQFVTAADITSGLLTYVPTAQGNGSGYGTFTFQVQDDGGTANSGIDLDASANTFTINVTAVNDGPVNSVPGSQTTDQDTAKVFSSGNGNLISISDIDATTVQVQLVSTNGATTLSTLTGLTFSVGDGTADATMTFTGTIAAINTALDGLSFNPTAGYSGSAASLQIVTSDLGGSGSGGTLTDNDTVTITVTGRPVVLATVANLNYTENGSAVLLDSLIGVTDADSNITGATVSMTTNYVNGQDTLAFTNQLGITGSWSAATGVLTLSGTTTPADYQTAMRTITYVNSSENPATSNRNVNFVASDAIGAGNTASRQVAVTAVNDAPVNTVPSTQTTNQDTAKVFSTGNSNVISVADVDAATVQVQLVSTNGATTLFGTMPGSLTFTVGDGTADATMTFSGTKAAVNTALDGLSFNPTGGYFGSAASLQIITSDLGATGTGGTLTDNDTVVHHRDRATDRDRDGGQPGLHRERLRDCAGLVDHRGRLGQQHHRRHHLDDDELCQRRGHPGLHEPAGDHRQLERGHRRPDPVRDDHSRRLPDRDAHDHLRQQLREPGHQQPERELRGQRRHRSGQHLEPAGGRHRGQRRTGQHRARNAVDEPGHCKGVLERQQQRDLGRRRGRRDGPGPAGQHQRRDHAIRHHARFADLHRGRRHRGRHDDVQRNQSQRQHRAERAELQPDRRLQRFGQPPDRHQRPGRHRHRRHPDRQRHRHHHSRQHPTGRHRDGCQPELHRERLRDRAGLLDHGHRRRRQHHRRHRLDDDQLRQRPGHPGLHQPAGHHRQLERWHRRTDLVRDHNSRQLPDRDADDHLRQQLREPGHQQPKRELRCQRLRRRGQHREPSGGRHRGQRRTRQRGAGRPGDHHEHAKVYQRQLSAISVADVDAATVQVQLVSTNGATTLFGSMPGSLTFTAGDGTADATMTFSGTIANVNTALNGLSFNPTTSFLGTASLQIITSDLGATGTGGTLTDNDTVNITVTGRPVVTATVANLAYTENGSATALDSLITVTDPDSNITGATVSMTTNYVNGEDTLAFVDQLGITGSWSAATGVLTLSGTTTPANYQTAMRTITYVNSSENPATSNRNVNFVASDAIGAGNTSSRQVAVTAVNDAPVNTMPATQATDMNTAEVFSSGNGSLISVSRCGRRDGPGPAGQHQRRDDAVRHHARFAVVLGR